MKFVVLLFGFLLRTSVCVLVQKVVVPKPAVASGRSALLHCWWSEGGGPALYSLRWCKDGLQFFAVTLVPELRKTVFPAPGVHVKLSASDQYQLSLANVTSLTSGTYTCEAMSDAPHFFSSTRSAYLSVVEGPANGPTWKDVLSVYHIDQQLHAHCNVFGSRPPASFNFFLNGRPVKDGNGWIIKQDPVKSAQGSIWNSSSTLSIPLNYENIKTLLPKSFPKLRTNSFRGTHRSIANHHSRFQTNAPASTYSSHIPALSVIQSAASSVIRPVRPRHAYSHSISSKSPFFLSPSHSSHTFPPKTLRINLTCVANVGGLLFRTSTWSSVSLPFEAHPNSVSRLSGNSGAVFIPPLTLQVVIVLSLAMAFTGNM